MSGVERNPKAWGGTTYVEPKAEPTQPAVTVYANTRPVYPCSNCKHGIGATQDYWTVEGKNVCSACFELRYPGWRASWGRA